MAGKVVLLVGGLTGVALATTDYRGVWDAKAVGDGVPRLPPGQADIDAFASDAFQDGLVMAADQ